MTSTKNSNNVLFNEQLKLQEYIELITAEREIQRKRSKRLIMPKLWRIRARKEVFRLTAEIEAKQNYLAEIQSSINQLNQQSN